MTTFVDAKLQSDPVNLFVSYEMMSKQGIGGYGRVGITGWLVDEPVKKHQNGRRIRLNAGNGRRLIDM